MIDHPSRRAFLPGALGLLLVRRTDAAGGGETTIEIGLGRLRGYRNGDVHVYKGVPYGASPAGAQCFQAPRPAPPWPGVRDATESGPSSVQTVVGIDYAKNLPANIPPDGDQ